MNTNKHECHESAYVIVGARAFIPHAWQGLHNATLP